MSEIWKDVNGREGQYQVSNKGRVKSLHYNWSDSERMLIPQKHKNGYVFVQIGRKWKSVHRLVAETFIDNPNNLPQINHLDGNKSNNCVENLEWVSAGDNLRHAYKTGLRIATSNHLKKRVIQLDKEGNFLKAWGCTKDVERALNIYHSNISACCKGKLKTSGGYVWRYADDWKPETIDCVALGTG